MTAGYERDIFTGLVAVQLRFIDHDQFVAALSEWVQDKETHLSQVLLRRGDIDEATRALIASVVEKHVDLHGGDAAASLSALELSDSTDRALRSVADPQVEATRSLFTPPREADAVTRRAVGEPSSVSGREVENTEAADTSDADPNRKRGRFTILRSLDRGGLGEVYVAEDHELNRLVALKEIQPRHREQGDSRARFLLEGETTGQLEHPGIVPVYGLGTDDGGNPFYAMRLVKGDNLSKAIARFFETRPRPQRRDYLGKEFRRLLGRFIDVCEAIQFAHARGVLHRDLKPGNIMLGRHGETLVVDWGLSRATGVSGDPETSVVRPPSGDSVSDPPEGSALGTPHYMSPEAARGELSDLTPATDVYSLGATLYHMLTGRPPYGDGNAVGELRAGTPPRPPRQQTASVPRPLEAVCLKAMAADPSDRYESCRELAEDVERFLADEAVAAMRDPPLTRTARTVRRHQGAFATAAVLGTLSLIGLSALSLKLADRNRELTLITAEAQRQRDIATRSAEVSQQLAEDLSEVVEKRLGESPGDQAVRERLIDRTSGRLTDLAAITNDPDELLLLRARAGRIAASLKRSARRYAEAAADLDEVVKAARRAFELGLADAEELVRGLIDRSIIRKYQDRNAEAVADLDEASGLLPAFADPAADDEESLELRTLLGRMWMERSGSAEIAQDYAAMLEAAANAETFTVPLAQREDADDVARAYGLMPGSARSRALWQLGRSGEAAAAFRAVAATGRDWADRFGGRNTRHFAGRAIYYRCLDLLELDDRPAEFADLAREAAEIYRGMDAELGSEYPKYRDYRRRAELIEAVATADAGDLAAAESQAVEVEDYFNGLVDADELGSEYLTDAASAAAWRAEFARLRADTAAWVEHLRRAVDRQSQAAAFSPAVPVYRDVEADYRRRLKEAETAADAAM